MAFMFLSCAGYVVTSEQGTRIAKSAKDAEDARAEDYRNKIKYDNDVKRLENKIDDTRDTIAIFARNSPDSTKWDTLLAAIDRIRFQQPTSTTVVIPPVSSGNLKERAISLAKELNSFVAYRNKVLEYRYTKEVKPGEDRWPVYKSWSESTSGWYRSRYEQRVISLVSELATLHLRDQRLDEDIEFIKSMEQSQRFTGNRTSVDLFTVQQIAERIEVLANSIH